MSYMMVKTDNSCQVGGPDSWDCTLQTPGAGHDNVLRGIWRMGCFNDVGIDVRSGSGSIAAADWTHLLPFVPLLFVPTHSFFWSRTILEVGYGSGRIRQVWQGGMILGPWNACILWQVKPWSPLMKLPLHTHLSYTLRRASTWPSWSYLIGILFTGWVNLIFSAWAPAITSLVADVSCK